MRIALCDDHPIVADGIAMLLQAMTPQLYMERHFTAHSLLQAAPNWLQMDLVMLDLGLPDANGLETLRRLRGLRDDVPVVIISSQADRTTILRAIDEGAMGFVPKSSATSTMMQALQVVLDGNVYLPPMEDESNIPLQGTLNLTPRQWQILRRILQGKVIKNIARELDIAECTVKTHVTPILRELGVTTRTEAIVKAGLMQLRLPPEPVGGVESGGGTT